jgi:hypothetical protein
MPLTDPDAEFLRTHHSAAMITLAHGVPKVARVGIALVDGKVWSSSTEARVRTRRLRGDPRCTLFVFEPTFAWLALETTVTILDGPDAARQSVRLFREMQGKPTGPLSWFGGELDEADFVEAMISAGRLIYEFEVHRSYGLRP